MNTNYQNRTIKPNSLSLFLIKNKLAKNDTEAKQILLIVSLMVISLAIYFLFVDNQNQPIDPSLIENAGSPDEIVNT